MKIKVGDRVKFLNDTGAGAVTRIIDQKTALVQIDGGFEVPWLIRDLVVESGTYYADEEPEEMEEVIPVSKQQFSEKTEPEQSDVAQEDEELIMALLPSSSGGEFTVYLVNSSSYNVKYTIARLQEGELVLFDEGTLEPGIKIDMGRYMPRNLNVEEVFRIQALFYNKGFYRPLSPVDMLVRIDAQDLYDSDKRNRTEYFREKVNVYTIYNWKTKIKVPAFEINSEELRKAMLTKGDEKPEKKQKDEPGPEEVDLHIGQLVRNHSELENSEIIEIQLSRFRTALDSAIIHKTKRIVFIHGVGNGKLKHELRRILDNEYKKSVTYQDASFREYGYGATMVLVK